MFIKCPLHNENLSYTTLTKNQFELNKYSYTSFKVHLNKF